ncbi:MAG: NAD-dependent epimerase/dehydratase family protein [Actinobacteria bacterium]|nr:NAD-dependent epimerase/dehydratase family protein [Actinomycetota bacterium]
MEGVEVTTGLPSKEFWSTKRVLVTGATGMVGAWLTRWLVDAGAHTVAFVSDADPQSELMRSGYINRVAVMNGRLENYEDVERAINNQEVDSIIHLGAQPIVGAADRSPRHTFESNIQGTWNVLDAARVLGGLVERVVVASSDKAYGTQPVLPYTEDMSMNGDHPYEVSKSCTDLISTTYARTYGLPVTIARCGNIYGGGDLNWNRIVPGTFRSIIRGEQPVLRSDGTFVRDYLHVDDIVSAYLLLGERSHEDELKGQGFNFSDESPLTVMQIYLAICEAAGKSGLEPKVLNAAVGEIKDQYLDSSKAHNVLGWKASVSLSEGLSKSWQWYNNLLGGK